MALQAVEPKKLFISVFLLPHLGQATTLASLLNRLLSGEDFSGGAIPYSFSFFLPASLIQSVVHAGDKTVLTENFSMPFSFSLLFISLSITFIAGQPV